VGAQKGCLAANIDVCGFIGSVSPAQCRTENSSLGKPGIGGCYAAGGLVDKPSAAPAGGHFLAGGCHPCRLNPAKHFGHCSVYRGLARFIHWNQPVMSQMHLPHDAMLLRIFIGESDRWNHQPLYEAIVLKAREKHLAGATVLRGPMGFGKSSRLHTAKILRLSMDLPLVIEIVDSEEKIQQFLPLLDEMMKGGLVTLEKVRVIDYRAEARNE
jgi:PII-like signaling protein